MTLNNQQQFSPFISVPVEDEELCWYRVYAQVFAEERLDGETKKLPDEGKWKEIYIDIDGAAYQPYDSLKVYFWNTKGRKRLYIDDIKIAKACK